MADRQRQAAIVTGGAKRIGRAVVKDLAARGHGVAIHCHRSREAADELAARIVADGGQAAVIVADLSDTDSVSQIVPEAEAALGPIGILVNNASQFEPDSADAVDPALFERQMRINLLAPCRLAGDLAARLPDGGEGVVINILDQRVWRLTPTFFSYTLSKSALWTATRTMAQTFAPRVRVAAIGPGPTLPNARQRPRDFALQATSVLLGHGPTLEEVAAAVRFIVDSPSYTGQMLALDGGQHLAWATADATAPE
ncbi:MAG TPA: SDR family oxidoreductase [Methylomirabilota bacterium]|nr:SDR family oxidoreductase [Methylomirabilota bacterium]